MGVEPTAARAVRPAASFEDWEAHRDSDTPADHHSRSQRWFPGQAGRRSH